MQYVASNDDKAVQCKHNVRGVSEERKSSGNNKKKMERSSSRVIFRQTCQIIRQICYS